MLNALNTKILLVGSNTMSPRPKSAKLGVAVSNNAAPPMIHFFRFFITRLLSD